MASDNTLKESSLKNAYRVLRKHGLWCQVPILMGLLLSGVLEGVSLTTLIPIIGMLADPNAAHTSKIQQQILRLFEIAHLPVSFFPLCFVIIAATFVKAVIMLRINRYVGEVVAEIASELRHRVLDRLLAARWSYFTVNPVGRFVAAIVSEANWAGYAYRSALSVAAMLIRAVVLTGVAFIFGWRTAVVTIALGLLMGLALRQLAVISRRAAKNFRAATRNLISDLVDLIVGYKPLKAMGKEGLLINSLRREVATIRSAMYDLVMMQQLTANLPDLLITCALVGGIYVISLYLGIALDHSVAFAISTYGLMNGVARVQKATQELAQSDTMYWAVLSLIKELKGEVEPRRGSREPVLESAIELQNVSFSYNRGQVLDNVSITIPAGRVTALVGESGSGKTTIADLILGLFMPGAGRITLDGVNLDEIDIDKWRLSLGYVPQEVLMFNDTIEANIRLGDPALTEDDIRGALKTAGLLDFVESLPDGLQSNVGERGMMLSGGQRQRLALARAIVHRPQFLVLDEATSALDPVTEAEICAAVRSHAGEMTILAITHQKSWVDIADRVYLIERGNAELVKATEASAATTPPSAALSLQ